MYGCLYPDGYQLLLRGANGEPEFQEVMDSPCLECYDCESYASVRAREDEEAHLDASAESIFETRCRESCFVPNGYTARMCGRCEVDHLVTRAEKTPRTCMESRGD